MEEDAASLRTTMERRSKKAQERGGTSQPTIDLYEEAGGVQVHEKSMETDRESTTNMVCSKEADNDEDEGALNGVATSPIKGLVATNKTGVSVSRTIDAGNMVGTTTSVDATVPTVAAVNVSPVRTSTKQPVVVTEQSFFEGIMAEIDGSAKAQSAGGSGEKHVCKNLPVTPLLKKSSAEKGNWKESLTKEGMKSASCAKSGDGRKDLEESIQSVTKTAQGRSSSSKSAQGHLTPEEQGREEVCLDKVISNVVSSHLTPEEQLQNQIFRTPVRNIEFDDEDTQEYLDELITSTHLATQAFRESEKKRRKEKGKSVIVKAQDGEGTRDDEPGQETGLFEGESQSPMKLDWTEVSTRREVAVLSIPFLDTDKRGGDYYLFKNSTSKRNVGQAEPVDAKCFSDIEDPKLELKTSHVDSYLCCLHSFPQYVPNFQLKKTRVGIVSPHFLKELYLVWYHYHQRGELSQHDPNTEEVISVLHLHQLSEFVHGMKPGWKNQMEWWSYDSVRHICNKI